jgi:hypothetical protein
MKIDITATRYGYIKQFDMLWERKHLGESITPTIGALIDPRILDVGAGIG